MNKSKILKSAAPLSTSFLLWGLRGQIYRDGSIQHPPIPHSLFILSYRVCAFLGGFFCFTFYFIFEQSHSAIHIHVALLPQTAKCIFVLRMPTHAPPHALIDCVSPFLPQRHPPIPFLGQSQGVWIDIPLGWYPSWDWADFVQSERAFAWICEIVVRGQCGPEATLICLYHLEIK